MEHIKLTQYITYSHPLFWEYSHSDVSRGLAHHHVACLRRGSARIVTLSGEELRLRAGDAFYLPMGLCYHSYWYGDEADAERCVEWDTVAFTYFPEPSGRRYAPQLFCLDLESASMLEHLWEKPFDTMTASGWLYLFLGRMLPNMIEIQPNPKLRVLETARRYITDYPNCNVEQLAQHCGVSPSGLYALFHEQSTMTIRELKNRARIEQASELLATTEFSVEEISRRLEFSSAAYFRLIFKQITGKTPTDVRREKKWM